MNFIELIVFTMMSVATLHVVHGQGESPKCGKCMDNLVSCYNETSFHWCDDGKTPSATLFHCRKGEVCSSDKDICIEHTAENKPLCKPKCGSCIGDNLFACKSQRTYSICRNGTIGKVQFECPGNQFCNIDQYKLGGSICAPSCAYEPTCSSAAAEVITPAPKTAPIDAAAICKKNSDKEPGNYVNDADPTCTTFAYCEKSIAYARRCNQGTYFSTKQGDCITEKTEGCK